MKRLLLLILLSQILSPVFSQEKDIKTVKNAKKETGKTVSKEPISEKDTVKNVKTEPEKAEFPETETKTKTVEPAKSNPSKTDHESPGEAKEVLDDCCEDPNEVTGKEQDHSSHKGHHDHKGMKGHSHADHSQHHRPDGMPPVGVMGTHTHMEGTWVIDYRYMGMDMKDLYYNKKPINPYSVLYGMFNDPTVTMPMTGTALPSPAYAGLFNPNPYRYMSAPVNMYMSMHMANMMYAMSDTLMIMVMLPYVQNKMLMVANNFERTYMSTYGLGDISVMATKKFYTKKHHDFYINTGLSLPTGSIDARDYMPMMGKSQTPYNMQPGTGTYNVMPGLGYTGTKENYSWGAQATLTLRTGKNQNNYRFGNRHEVTAWFAYKWNSWFSTSGRLHYQLWDNNTGMDPSLDYKMDPQNDPNRQGGRRLDFLVGTNIFVPTGDFEGLRLMFEIGRPLHQHLNGPQLGVNTVFTIGASYAL